MSQTYDAIIVLATQPDPKTWKFPHQIYECLDRAKELLDKGIAPFIITSGNESISIKNRGLHQPFRECDGMADYLIEKGVPEDKILKEGDSMDTPSNIYYLKTEFFIPRNMMRLLFVIDKERNPRLEFLCKRILGPDYTFDYENLDFGGPDYPYLTFNEDNTFKVQSEFLAPMKDGDHAYLADKFYTAPMYDYWAKHDKEKYHLKD